LRQNVIYNFVIVRLCFCMRSLFLKKFLSLSLLILSVSYSFSVVAGEKVVKTLTVEKSGTVYVNVSRGLVKIIGWDKSEVLLKGEIDDSVENVVFKNHGKKTLVKIVSEGKKHWGDSSILKLFIPHDSHLHFKGVDTTFKVSDLTNGMEGRSIRGDLIVSQVVPKIVASSVSGMIKVSNSAGKARIESVNGQVDFSGDFYDVLIKSMSGDVQADLSDIDKLEIKSISGDIELIGHLKNEALVKLKSVSGDISYDAPEYLDAECELTSQFGGDIHSDYTDDLPESSMFEKKSLNFVSGNGSSELIIHTISGAINIKSTIVDKTDSDDD
jgi:hypothetical protein